MSKVMMVIILIFGLIAVIFTSMSALIIEEQSLFFEALKKDAVESESFDDFLAYQVSYYQLLERKEDAIYLVETYHAIAINGDEETHYLVSFLLPLQTVKIADTLDDPNDQMQVIFFKEDEVIYDSQLDDHTKGFALSYGLNEDQFGFIYQSVEIHASATYQLAMYDYDQNLIHSGDVIIDFSWHEDDFEPGWSSNEIQEKMNLTEKVIQNVSIYVALYLGLTMIGLGIYYTVKKIQKAKIK